jgi:hypothetical protein
MSAKTLSKRITIRTHEDVRPVFFLMGGFVVSGVLAAHGQGGDARRRDWVAYRGVFAAEAEVTKLRRKETIENGVLRFY